MVDSTSHTREVRRPSIEGCGRRTQTMPDALATSTAAATVRTRSVPSSSISTTLPGFKGTSKARRMVRRASPGAQEGYESLIGVLLAQCVALPAGPHTKLNYGLRTKNTTA